MSTDKNELVEIRTYTGDAKPTVTGRTIEGYAVIFGQRSNVMYDKENKRMFVEVIERGAIDDALIQRSDVKARLEHEFNRMMARSKNGKGTLTLELDDTGLKYRFEAPNTIEGNYCIEMIERGNIDGSSFAFISLRNSIEWTKMDNTMWLRTIKKIDGLYDISVTGDPAYSQTSVTVRSIDELDAELLKVQTPKKEEITEVRNDASYEIELELLRSKI